MTEEFLNIVLDELQVKNSFDLAAYQPKFIVDQVLSACKFRGEAAHFSEELIRDALKNLYTSNAAGVGGTKAKGVGSGANKLATAV